MLELYLNYINSKNDIIKDLKVFGQMWKVKIKGNINGLNMFSYRDGSHLLNCGLISKWTSFGASLGKSEDLSLHYSLRKLKGSY